MLEGYDFEVVNLQDRASVAEIRNFLFHFNLSFADKVEFTVKVILGERIIGTGSLLGEVLCNIAVEAAQQGRGLTAAIVSELLREQARRGRSHFFLFTRPANVAVFTSLGFTEIARAIPYASLLEMGLGSVESYCEFVEKEIREKIKEENGCRSAVVVNCNPFTLGHRALIERGAGESGVLIVFVVSSDNSLFPFAHRLEMVRAGVADLPNVVVVPSGKYIISEATFPTYFTREEERVTAQTRLDVSLFATAVAPRLKIAARYIGEEPYCPVTNAYNQAILDILPTHNLEVRLMQRVKAGDRIISASTVREMVRCNNWEGVQKMVPLSTYRFLLSPELQPVIEKIRLSHSRH